MKNERNPQSEIGIFSDPRPKFMDRETASHYYSNLYDYTSYCDSVLIPAEFNNPFNIGDYGRFLEFVTKLKIAGA